MDAKKLGNLVGTTKVLTKNWSLAPEPTAGSYVIKRSNAKAKMEQFKSPFYKAAFIICLEHSADKEVRRIGHLSAEQLEKIPSLRRIRICYEEIKRWVAGREINTVVSQLAQGIIEDAEPIGNLLRLLNGFYKIFGAFNLDHVPDIALNSNQKAVILDAKEPLYL